MEGKNELVARGDLPSTNKMVAAISFESGNYYLPEKVIKLNSNVNSKFCNAAIYQNMAFSQNGLYDHLTEELANLRDDLYDMNFVTIISNTIYQFAFTINSIYSSLIYALNDKSIIDMDLKVDNKLISNEIIVKPITDLLNIKLDSNTNIAALVLTVTDSYTNFIGNIMYNDLRNQITDNIFRGLRLDKHLKILNSTHHELSEEDITEIFVKFDKLFELSMKFLSQESYIFAENIINIIVPIKMIIEPS